MKRNRTPNLLLAALAGLLALTAASPVNQARRTAPVIVYLAPT